MDLEFCEKFTMGFICYIFATISIDFDHTLCRRKNFRYMSIGEKILVSIALGGLSLRVGLEFLCQ